MLILLGDSHGLGRGRERGMVRGFKPEYDARIVLALMYGRVERIRQLHLSGDGGCAQSEPEKAKTDKRAPGHSGSSTLSRLPDRESAIAQSPDRKSRWARRDKKGSRRTG